MENYIFEQPEKISYEEECKTIILLKKEDVKFKNLDKDHQENMEVLRYALTLDPNNIALVSDIYKNNEELALIAVKQQGFALMHFSEEIRNNRKVILEATNKNYLNLKYASADLRNDKYFAQQVLINNPNAIECFSKNIKDNFEIGKLVVEKKGNLLFHLSSKLKNNKEIVFKAMNQHSKAFEYAGKKLKNNFDIALYAVALDGWNLSFVSDLLKDNFEIVKTAISQENKFYALSYASENKKRNIELLISVFDKNAIMLDDFINDYFKNDQDILKSIELEIKDKPQKYFIKALKGIDILITSKEQEESLAFYPKPYFNRSIGWVVKNLDDNGLNEPVHNEYLKKCVLKEKEDRKIEALSIVTPKKNKNRKLVF